MDTSVPRSMKSAAKCDNSREPQSPVTRRIFERTSRRGVLPRRVRSSVANRPLRREARKASSPLRRRVGSSAFARGSPRMIPGVKSLAAEESPFRAGDVPRGSRPSSAAEESSGRKDETRARRYPPVRPLVLLRSHVPLSRPRGTGQGLPTTPAGFSHRPAKGHLPSVYRYVDREKNA